MDSSNVATLGNALTESFEKLFLSTVRLSGAATLYGVQQLENAVSGLQGGEGLAQQLDRLETTFNSLTECLVEEISPSKKDALESISNITAQMVRQSFDSMTLLDPRQVFRFAGNLAQKSSETISSWAAKKESAAAEEPRLAAEVLAS